MKTFAARLIAWQKRHGRHDLPWQNTRDPYAIWVSEIMLQQTQVAAVIPYYQRFLRSFPDISTLAAAQQDEVLARWSGLGYYSRARNLHRAARIIVQDHAGRFPADYEQVLALPGIGRSTAAAVCVFAFGARRAILDGNVKRVLARYLGIEGYPGEKRIEDDLWHRAEGLLPKRDIEAYIQGLMDLGAGVCVRRHPRCAACPLRSDCVAHRRGLTDRLPMPKPKKTLPRKKTVMLVLQHAGEVLLEKRPDTGIWGGLWCFPEVAHSEDIESICARHFDAIALNIWGDREVTWTDGKVRSEKEFAAFLKVQFTPTLLFFDEKGKVVLRLNGYYPPHQFRAALDYVSGKHENKTSFADYLQRNAGEADSGKLHDQPFFLKPPFNLDRSRKPAAKPLAVLFEQQHCAACDEMHAQGFKDKATLALAGKFDVVRLELFGKQPVVTPDGKSQTEEQWARRLKVAYTPTIVFFDTRGKEVFRIEAYLKPFHFASSFDYVASGAYRTQPSFQRFIQGRAENIRARGGKVDLW